jgi:hypothetical protein
MYNTLPDKHIPFPLPPQKKQHGYFCYNMGISSLSPDIKDDLYVIVTRKKMESVINTGINYTTIYQKV